MGGSTLDRDFLRRTHESGFERRLRFITFHRFTAGDLDVFGGLCLFFVWCLFGFGCLVCFAFHDFGINLVFLRS